VRKPRCRRRRSGSERDCKLHDAPTRVEATTAGRTPPRSRREGRCETTVPVFRPRDRRSRWRAAARRRRRPRGSWRRGAPPGRLRASRPCRASRACPQSAPRRCRSGDFRRTPRSMPSALVCREPRTRHPRVRADRERGGITEIEHRKVERAQHIRRRGREEIEHCRQLDPLKVVHAPSLLVAAVRAMSERWTEPGRLR
jgi:hypothetical protein